MKRYLMAAGLMATSGALMADISARGGANFSSFGNYFSLHQTRESTTVFGFHGRDDTSYQIRHFADGRFEGVDAQGHHFVGNGNTGYYLNHGTGRHCLGIGEDRKCKGALPPAPVSVVSSDHN